MSGCPDPGLYVVPTGVRRTADYHSVKTRGLVIQGADGSFAPTGSVLAAYDEQGHYSPSIDLSLNSVTAVDGTFDDVTLVGPSTAGTLTWTDGLTVNGVPLPNFDPSGNVFQLLDPAAATLPTLIQSYNRLLSVLALRNAFVTIINPSIVFQTHCDIQLVDSSDTTITLSIPVSPAASPLAIVTQLNNQCFAASMPINFYLSPAGTITVTVASGYFYYTDVVDYGGGQRLMNHLGLNALITDAHYTGSHTGVAITEGRGSEDPVPSPPALPVVSDISDTTFRISFAPGDPSITYIGIYLGEGSAALDSWDIIGPSSSTYVFEDLAPNTVHRAAITYLTTYDESELSPRVTATTTQTIIYALDVLASPSTSGLNPPPSTQGYLNGVFWKVCDVSSSIWIPALVTVDQIKSITLQYYSGYTVGTTVISNATFSLGRDGPPTIDTTLFTARQRRVAPAQPGDYYGIGSPIPLFPGPASYPTGPISISNQERLRNFFGGGTNTIDKTRGIQFYWHVSTSGTLISNSQINKFIINYVA